MTTILVTLWCYKFLILRYLTNFSHFSWNSQCLLLQSLIPTLSRIHQVSLTILVMGKSLKSKEYFCLERFSLREPQMTDNFPNRNWWGYRVAFSHSTANMLQFEHHSWQLQLAGAQEGFQKLAGEISNSAHGPEHPSWWTPFSTHQPQRPGQQASRCSLHCRPG